MKLRKLLESVSFNKNFAYIDMICSDGDVRLASDNTPMFYSNGTFRPICGHWFWDNEYGADLFCRKLGFTTSHLDKLGRSESYTTDSVNVGMCKVDDTDVASCTGFCNSYKVGSVCHGQDSYSCRAGKAVRIKITCSGGSFKKSHSCRGNLYFITSVPSDFLH